MQLPFDFIIVIRTHYHASLFYPSMLLDFHLYGTMKGTTNLFTSHPMSISVLDDIILSFTHQHQTVGCKRMSSNNFQYLHRKTSLFVSLCYGILLNIFTFSLVNLRNKGEIKFYFAIPARNQFEYLSGFCSFLKSVCVKCFLRKL